jgi:hypothetical protein
MENLINQGKICQYCNKETEYVDMINEIIKFSNGNLKNAHIYCKINNLSGQMSGILIEDFIKNEYNMSKNNSSDCNGDLHSKEFGINYEIKISLGGKNNNKFNYVQLRLNL